ncbi:hypothetical protein NP590_01435 [Methylomonas sp. SURF-2]|uniref:Tetratricopeptide repeat protein n=1 Tax=Methylomonas subterranea TaxID=2952225 RepID=A0ABT1TBY3_9GAMM|nr:hypothetical protein [Methylomonas sp. SURF-2]MCQ8102751.1 hypothetical protein [Methylomonas sp. SURF-2]
MIDTVVNAGAAVKKIIQTISAGMSESITLQMARGHFAAGRYKEATESFKELLKKSNDGEYRRCLADCYLQRAQAMAGKGMFKEACILWENYADYAEKPLHARDMYVLWQLAAKNHRKAHAALEGFDGRQLDEDYPELAMCLGALLVSGLEELPPHLPQDSALLRHWSLIGEALAAYRNGDAEQCGQSLKKLPYRSAFRDLGILLKVQLLDTVSSEQAGALLSKIPETSPYRPVVNACLAYLKSGADFVDALTGLEHNQRRAVARARGISGKRADLLETLIKQKARLADKARFNLVLQYRDLFGGQAAQAYCQGALEQYPDGYADYLKHFSIADEFEENRVRALSCEQNGRGGDARYFWERCLDILKKDRPANDRKIALILRHLADRVSRADAAKLLAASLEFDPDDRQSYLGILSIYEKDQLNPAHYEQWLERGLLRFPANTELLVRAAKSAANRKAFKKAAAYAKALLKVDPVNTLAKQLLFANHMAHARRLLKTEKYHLVEKEIRFAEQLTVDKRLRLQAELLRGLYLWRAEDKNQGLQHIVDVLGKLNDNPVAMQFQAQMEAGLLELATAMLTKALPAFKDYLLSARELQGLIATLEYYDGQLDDGALLIDALDKIKAPVKKSLQWLLDHETLLLSWCRVLEQVGHFELLKHCAKMGHAKWRAPAWLYYLTVGECRGDYSRLDFMRLFALRDASEQAKEEGDLKTAVSIERILVQHDSYMDNPCEFEDEEAGLDDPEVENDPIEDLFGHLPNSIMTKVAKKAQGIMKKNDPGRLADKYIRRYAGSIDGQTLAILFMNQDFYASVTLLEAAEELRIDIGIDFENIVGRFQNDSPQFSLPFF